MSTTLWASSQILVRTWMTNHLCWKLELGVSRIIRNIYLKNISTWYFRWALNFVKNDRNIASKSSNTSQILETPFLDSDTHKYCFTAEMNISLDLKTGPAFWTTDNINWRLNTFDLSSWDLGSGGPSGKGFMESLHRDRKIRNASFW